LGEVRYGDEVVPEGIYATKAFPLPNNCVGLVFENITDRKQAEHALQQSEARFRVIAETAACAVLVYQGTRLRYANPATERITGYSVDELKSVDFWELAHPDYREMVKQRGLGRQRGEAVPSRYEIKIVTKSGQERWVDFTAGVLVLEGRPTAVATAYDITDRKQAEAKLLMAADQERLLSEMASRIRSSLDLEEILQTTVEEVRKFLQADRVFISCFDENNSCQAVAESVAPEWAPILGWQVRDCAVDEIRSLFQPNRLRVINDTRQIETTPFLGEYYQRCQVRAGMGISLNLEGRIFGVLIANQCSGPREWQPFEVELLEQLATGVEIAIKQGQLYRQKQTLAADLERQVEQRTAELRQRMQELQNLNQVKDLLLHAVSHDLRTPVQGMLMVMNRLRGRCCDSETVSISRSMLDRMIQSSEDQLQLLNALRDDHSSNEPKLYLERRLIGIDQVLQRALRTVEPVLMQNQVKLNNQVPTGLPTVLADPFQLQQVVESLLSNAVRHNLPGVTIALHAEVITHDSLEQPTNDNLPAKILRLTIEDSGTGMSQEQCDRLFKPYIRSLDNPHCTGIGLGLHRCRQILAAHNGQIGVISEPGIGSKFWLTLPLV
jgi:PAS domain S-box-containing protein